MCWGGGGEDGKAMLLYYDKIISTSVTRVKYMENISRSSQATIKTNWLTCRLLSPVQFSSFVCELPPPDPNDWSQRKEREQGGEY